MQAPHTLGTKIKNAMRIDRAFLFVWQASRKWTILNGILAAVQGIIPLFSLYLMKMIIDTIAEAVQTGAVEDGISRVIILIAAAGVVVLIQTATGKLAEYSSEAQSTIVTDHVYDTMHKKSIDLDLAYYENPQFYDTLHRAQREGPYRPTRIVNSLNQLGQSLVSLVVMVGLLFTFHWSTGLLLFVSTLPGVLVQVLFSRKRYKWQRDRTKTERRADYYSWVLTADSFAKELRLFNLGRFFSDAFNNLRTLIRGEKLALTRQRVIAEFLSQVFATIILMGCFLMIGIRTIKGMISIGDMVMYFQAFQRGLGHLKNLLQNIAGLYEDNLFVTHFFAFLDAENSVKDPLKPHPIPKTTDQGIELKNVEFKYPGERQPVLKDISLTIAPGEVVALVGANGAGKSTLVKLLCRLYDPQQGTITIDGVQLSQLALKDVRSQISVVFQDFVKYHLTAKENIWLGDTSRPIDSGRIVAAARMADADNLINGLPDGYDTVLGRWFESGEELSQGEWQKIVIARAFFKDPRLIILDEPTSSLDVNTEYHLFIKFRELIADRPALLISHRFSTVRMADRIYVLDDGQIAEEGTHKELLALKGQYADMYTKQAAWLTSP